MNTRNPSQSVVAALLLLFALHTVPIRASDKPDLDTAQSPGSTKIEGAASSLPPETRFLLNDDFNFERIDRGLVSYLDIFDVPGISVGIISNGEVVYERSFGQANRLLQTEVAQDTIYGIGSVTKLFTATLTMTLAEQGILGLDDPVSKYLPAEVAIQGDEEGAITIRSLLNHTSGLRRDPRNRSNIAIDEPFDPGLWDRYDIDDLYAALGDRPLKRAVAERYGYSNFGYGLLGHVLELATEKPYETLLSELIISPLGMTDTSITVGPVLEQRSAAHYWPEDPIRKERIRARFGEVAGFIGISSSLDDLLKFISFHLGNDAGPLSVAGRKKMREANILMEKGHYQTIRMALGWRSYSDRYDSLDLFGHSGEVDGHVARVIIEPSEKFGIVLLQNLGGTQGARGLMHLERWIIRTLQTKARL